MTLTERVGVAILGSTGSIGRSTLDVVSAHPERFELVALAAGRNVTRLHEQVCLYDPVYVSAAEAIEIPPSSRASVVDSANPLEVLATLPEVDIVVVATTGHAAISPTIAALNAGKVVALANKETIVAAGEIVMPIARAHPGSLRPVDSEHSALWQCLGTDRVALQRVERLILTASGGPFRGWTQDQLHSVTPEQALRHPTWDMGAKITIDSATLMNKGLELIEAHWLFDCPLDRIDVAVHPQSIVHSLVEYVDGSFLAQLGSHDMRLAIQYALTYPDRLPGPQERLNIRDLSRLDFEPADAIAFPLLNLARQAATEGSTYPTVLSAADSVAVEAFLDGQISFTGIAELVSEVLDAHTPTSRSITLDDILGADEWATREVARRIHERTKRR